MFYYILDRLGNYTVINKIGICYSFIYARNGGFRTFSVIPFVRRRNATLFIVYIISNKST